MENIKKTVLQFVYYYNDAQRYEQLFTGWSTIIFLILLCIFDLCGAIRNKIFLVTSFSLPFSELSLVGLAIDLVD